MRFDKAYRSRRSNVMGLHGMVATNQPLAANAGLDMLKKGGTAADAAIAVTSMLNVVQPSSTGIGGDLFALFWDAKAKRVTALNGSGRAGKAANIEGMRRLGYTQMPMFTGAAVSVPGAVAGWTDLLQRHGRMDLKTVLQPAIQTAEQGYPVTELMARSWQNWGDKVRRSPAFQSSDLDNGPEQPSGQELLLNGRPPKAGEVMRLPTLGKTLRGIASEGRDYIYKGEFARTLSEHVQRYGGCITPEDMAKHTSTWDEPITGTFRDVTLYECPPNGTGLAAILAVNIANGYDLATMSEADRAHAMIECMRLAFADVQQWVCDPTFAKIPLDKLLSVSYATQQRARIDMRKAATDVPSGCAPMSNNTVYASIVDGEGNACSFISSLYYSAGTGLVVPGTGVALQNRASLFVLEPDHPNALAGDKRPYQTIIPAMTTRDGELHACMGSVGGHQQPQVHFQALVNMLDLDLPPQQALDKYRFRLVVENGPQGAEQPGGLLMLEEGWDLDVMVDLSKRGHRLSLSEGFNDGFGQGQIILRNPDTGVMIGGSDPRSDGCTVAW